MWTACSLPGSLGWNRRRPSESSGLTGAPPAPIAWNQPQKGKKDKKKEEILAGTSEHGGETMVRYSYITQKLLHV